MSPNLLGVGDRTTGCRGFLMMKRLLVGCAAAVVAFSTPALAADVAPGFKAPPAPPAAYNWSGLYGGLNAGYSGGHVPYDATTFGAPSSGTLNPDGFIGGGQIGYNFQAGSFVFGVESDIACAMPPRPPMGLRPMASTAAPSPIGKAGSGQCARAPVS